MALMEERNQSGFSCFFDLLMNVFSIKGVMYERLVCRRQCNHEDSQQ